LAFETDGSTTAVELTRLTADLIETTVTVVGAALQLAAPATGWRLGRLTVVLSVTSAVVTTDELCWLKAVGWWKLLISQLMTLIVVVMTTLLIIDRRKIVDDGRAPV